MVYLLSVLTAFSRGNVCVDLDANQPPQWVRGPRGDGWRGHLSSRHAGRREGGTGCEPCSRPLRHGGRNHRGWQPWDSRGHVRILQGSQSRWWVKHQLKNNWQPELIFLYCKLNRQTIFFFYPKSSKLIRKKNRLWVANYKLLNGDVKACVSLPFWECWGKSWKKIIDSSTYWNLRYLQ